MLKTQSNPRGRSDLKAETSTHRKHAQCANDDVTDGRRIEADLVVVAVGISPIPISRARLAPGINRGIMVNDGLETRFPAIMPSVNAPSIAAMLWPGRAGL
jgi:NAD(P)H-nitrite reductase large subunit